MARVAVLASLAPLSGCGTNRHRQAPPRLDLHTAAQAVSFARHVQLRSSDMPASTLRSQSREKVTYPSKAGRALRCLGIAAPPVVEINSQALEEATSGATVRSTISLMPNNAVASHSVAAIFSARGPRCLSNGLGAYTTSPIATKAPIAGERLDWTSNGGA